MKFLLLLALVIPGLAGAVAPHQNYVPEANFEFDFNKSMGPVGFKYFLGTVLRQAHTTAVGKYDYSVTGGAAGDHKVGITLPAKALIRHVFFDVVTGLTMTGGSAGVAFKAASAGDLKAHTASASWTGRLLGVPDGLVANMIELSAEKVVYATLSGTATTGKIKVFVDYVMTE